MPQNSLKYMYRQLDRFCIWSTTSRKGRC